MPLAVPRDSACVHCGMTLPSRNKLFRHIEECKENPRVRKLLDEAEQEGLEEDDDEGAGAADVDALMAAALPVVARHEGFYRVVVKPQGLPTMGGRLVRGEPSKNAASHDSLVIKERTVSSKVVRALPCHRLDAPTGGLLVCAETYSAGVDINAAFRTRLVHKRYRAIVPGTLDPPAGSVDVPLSGKPSRTEYKTVCVTPSRQYGTITTVDLWPITGRMHQLRRHLAELGCPILGDRRYSRPSTWPRGLSHLLLWSLEVSFPDPSRVALESMVKGGAVPVISPDLYVHAEIPEPIVFEAFRRDQERAGAVVVAVAVGEQEKKEKEDGDR